MNKRPARKGLRRTLSTTRRTAGWASLFGERLGKKKACACTFCGVIGSHRRGCHYVTEAHHRGPKTVRRGALGLNARKPARGKPDRMNDKKERARGGVHVLRAR